MTLRKRTLIIVGLASLVLVLALSMLLHVLVFSNFRQLEREVAADALHRVYHAIDAEFDAIELITEDWASWDDTYRFIDDRNDHYLQSNLPNAPQNSTPMDVIAYVDSAGKLAYAAYMSDSISIYGSLPDGFQSYVEQGDSLLSHPDMSQSVRGVVVVDGVPYLTVSCPILTSDSSGPSRGSLIMARRITEDLISDMERRTNSSLSIAIGVPTDPFPAVGFPSTFLDRLNCCTIEPTPDSMIVRGTMPVLESDKHLLLTVETDRPFRGEILKTLRIYLYSLIATIILIVTLATFLLERTVLHRMRRLSRRVLKIGQSKDFRARVPEEGTDELTQLANSLNTMLAALEESHQEIERDRMVHRRVIQNQGEGVGVVDLEETLVFCNPAMEDLFGVEHGKLVGRNLSEFLSPETLAFVQAQTQERLTGKVGSYEIEILRDDGEQRTILATVTPHLDADGHVAGAYGVCRDVTERTAAKRALEESEARFRSIFQNAAIGISMLDVDGRYVDVNPAYERMLGYPREHLIGRRFTEVTHPAHVPDELRGLHAMVRGEVSRRQVTKRYLRSDGSIAWASLVVSAVYDSDGAYEYSIGMVEDITERIEAERQFRLLTAAVEQTGEIIVITDVRGRIVYANPAFEQVTGHSRTDAIGQDIRVYGDPDNDGTLIREAERTVTSGHVWSGRMANRRHDGSFFESEATISPFYDEKGRQRGAVFAFKDITQQIELETQLRQAQKMEAIGRLAGGIAHDFNNLLTIITAFAELLQLRLDGDDISASQLQEIIDATAKGSDLVQRLLTFGRKAVLTPRAVNPNVIVNDVERLLGHVIGENIEVVIELAPGLRTIQADKNQIEQMLINLATNSRDAMPDGGRLTIRTTNVNIVDDDEARRLEVPRGHYVLITVADTGTGMDEETRAKVFEPFFSTKGEAGTGIGLASAYGVVTQHGGAILCTSTPGEGTVFEIYFPAGEDTGGEEARTSGEAIRGGSETILVVEDEPSILSVSTHLLQDSGYTVLAAPSCSDALSVSRKHKGRIHLLLTDLILPDGNGHELAQVLTSERPGMGVLYTSGYTDSIIARHGILEDDVAFLPKPYHLNDLLMMVREVLDALDAKT